MTKQDTKLRILNEAAKIIHCKGFNNTGIQEILNASRVPKGSFYFYFKSKEDFGLQLIDHFQGFILRRMKDQLEASDASPLERLRRFFEGTLEGFRCGALAGGCPIGNLAQELGDSSDKFRMKLGNALDQMEDCVVRCLEEARDQGEIDQSLDPKETANFILNSWEGSILRMKATGGVEPLITFEKMIFDRVLAR